MWTLEDGNRTSAQRNMKLQFKNTISRKISIGEEIRGEDNNPLQVVLVDDSTGNMVDMGPESSATVEILLLKGASNASEGDDWPVEQFNKNIVRGTEQKPLLAGNQCIKLQNGTGFLENIKFKHHATKMKPSVFKLGARVVDTFHGVCIKEGQTRSFVVKDFRNKYSGKHKTPSLSDEVFRLKNIGKGGKIEKRLHDYNIRTVENFLIQHLIDPEGLKTIVKLKGEKWKDTVENALACPSFCVNDQKTMGVVFYLRGQILGLCTERKYVPTDKFSEKEKADAKELLESAYKHREKIGPFDDEESSQRHFNSFDCSADGHENAQTSEMNPPKVSQTVGGDRSLFETPWVENCPDTFFRDFPQYSPQSAGLFPDIVESMDQNLY